MTGLVGASCMLCFCHGSPPTCIMISYVRCAASSCSLPFKHDPGPWSGSIAVSVSIGLQPPQEDHRAPTRRGALGASAGCVFGGLSSAPLRQTQPANVGEIMIRTIQVVTARHVTGDKDGFAQACLLRGVPVCTWG